MPVQVANGYCFDCDSRVSCQKKVPNHRLHLFLSMLMLGIWLPVWGLLFLTHGPWRCTRCGEEVSYRTTADRVRNCVMGFILVSIPTLLIIVALRHG